MPPHGNKAERHQTHKGNTMEQLEKIETFLAKVEGSRQVRGYIPCYTSKGGTANYYGAGNPKEYKAMGASGVTVATGVDLGQTDTDMLRSIGVRTGTIHFLLPYLGKKRSEALQVLHRLPLTLSASMAEELDHAVHGYHLESIRARYDREAGKGAYNAAPWQAQAVIFSLLYHMGCGAPNKIPITWQALVAGQWATAAQELCSDNWAQYVTRRHAEGALLRTLP
jgi:GH24 family phage-related lysozyme (muramidase)